ncbi:Periplasmic oligopeptide-binding protein [Actinoplanes sp. SE50]|uniref:ABC transporter family substrate-binding protein n=1 Tax=unclassified Actinoplanes TaxID=2626549 RepID=UPI00023EC759|nr:MULTISPECIES: ABC transporter family substrate-binding protein [unclassified Actinoplanes]AEV83088.1 Periplasmic oligopeptide-binding protein [Actinoplanes sp. SE50/110]ATO81484.1 Periplasmic oligopeptide-binding protein [Actinoplanes sp. SE50]SLL98891.1 ABC-type peptide/nickel transporter, substrate-binding lipoprotein [Actinoplanes sp. SE50/110]
MRKPWSARAILAPVVAATLIGTAACSGSSGTTTNQAAPPPKASENQINPKSRDQVKDGGTLTWALSGFPANFNYYELDGTDVDASYVNLAMMPQLYNYEADATPVWNKNYLASEPVLKTDPKQVVTFELNPKATWNDGAPITWEDLYWQWKSTSGADKAYNISASNGYENIESVAKGKDDHEAIVTFKTKYADWQSLFTPFYPASTNKDPKTFNAGWQKSPLKTTAGPFKFDSADATAKTITLVRNEKWWGDPAKLDKIVFRAIEPNAQVDALANGEIDFVDIGSNVDAYQRALKISTAEIRKAAGPNFRHLTINGTSTVLSDVKVRQALAQAIDRTAIAKALTGPLGIDPKALNNHIFMSNQAGYQDNSGDIGKYDVEKAKAGLDAAGWKLNGDTREKDGKKLEINFVIPTGVKSSEQESQLVQNMLAQVGAKVKINAVPVDDFFDKYVTPGNFDMTVFAWIGTQFPVSSAKSIYANPTKNAKGELDIQQNYARVGSPELDTTFNNATAELDKTKAATLANQADAQIWQEVHSLTLYQRPELIATKKDLANFGAKGFASVIYENIGFVK